jgi:hypothetical protein
VDTETFKPVCVRITENRRDRSYFSLESFEKNSKFYVDKMSGKLMVECIMELEVWPGKENSAGLQSWITVIAGGEGIQGGGKERQWEQRMEIEDKSTDKWTFEEYDAKRLANDGLSLMIFTVVIYVVLII